MTVCIFLSFCMPADAVCNPKKGKEKRNQKKKDMSLNGLLWLDFVGVQYEIFISEPRWLK